MSLLLNSDLHTERKASTIPAHRSKLQHASSRLHLKSSAPIPSACSFSSKRGPGRSHCFYTPRLLTSAPPSSSFLFTFWMRSDRVNVTESLLLVASRVIELIGTGRVFNCYFLITSREVLSALPDFHNATHGALLTTLHAI